MAAFQCRICQIAVPRHRAIDLFGPKVVKEKLCCRISDLLDVPVSANDGLSQYICEKCKRKLDRLERAAEELNDFRLQAHRTYQELGLRRRDLRERKRLAQQSVYLLTLPRAGLLQRSCIKDTWTLSKVSAQQLILYCQVKNK